MNNDNSELKKLIKEISANQMSLHEDISAVLERLTKLEAEVTELTIITGEPIAIDETELYLAARALVLETQRCSTSYLQRILRIGYSRAAMLIDKLEKNGIIGPSEGAQPREILIDFQTLQEQEEKGSISSKE